MIFDIWLQYLPCKMGMLRPKIYLYYHEIQTIGVYQNGMTFWRNFSFLTGQMLYV